MYDNEKKDYIKVLRLALSVIEDFGGIDYVAKEYTGAEYIKVWDIIGGVQFLDVTGYRLDGVLHDVAMLLLGKKPDSLITQVEIKKDVARLFAR